MLNLLKAKWVFHGLEAPIISWVIVIALVLFMAGYWLKMYLGVFRLVSKQIGLAKWKLAHIQKSLQISYKNGLEARSCDEISQILEQNEILKPCWRGFTKHLIRRSREGGDFFWSAEIASAAFNESALIGSRLNLTFCQALPSILTGIGLLFTFIAILIALLDVKLINNRVQGIELLIQGLSGKFVSSIAALFLATIHVIVEKTSFQRLRNNCHQLAQTLDNLFPRLTHAHLLENIRSQVAEQTLAIRNFNSSLAPALTASINEGVGPTLERMADSIENLNGLLRQNAAQQQQSITGSIETLLKDLSTSLTSSITRMGDSFSTNLVGSAQTQFSEMRDSLSSTTELLNGMNDKFGGLTSDLAAKFEQILGTHSQQINKVEELRDTLTSTLSNFREVIETHTGMIHGLGETAARITETVDAANETMRETRAMREAFELVAEQTRAQADHLERANERQGEIWETLESDLTKYAETFSHVEKAANSLLSQISKDLNSYTELTRSSFKDLVEIADGHFSNATSKLGASVKELDEFLSDLTDKLENARHNGHR
jgi:hypothetical protein